jgi:hypothetical protein
MGSIIEKASLNSTCHSIPKIVRTKNPVIKIIWIGATIVSFSLCVLLIYEAIKDFLEYHTVTKMRIIHEQTPYFPTITICNKDPLVTKKSLQHLNEYMLKNGINDYLAPFNDLSDNGTATDTINEHYVDFLKTIYVSNDDKLKKSMGFTFDDFILKCLFNGVRCNSLDFDWLYDVNYGNCFQFNTGFDRQISTINTQDKKKGLFLKVFIGFNEEKVKLNYREITNGKFFLSFFSFFSNKF